MGKIDHTNMLAHLQARATLEAEIERLIALLDILDGDPDLEPDSDSEPSLARFGAWNDAGDDLEVGDGECG